MIDPLSDDDQILRALGQRAREQAHAQPRAWEAVALGERSDDEVGAERLAAGDSPEAVAVAREVFRPPSGAEHDAMVEALLARRSIDGAASREPLEVLAPPAEAAANDPGRPRWAVAVAVAAAIALAWWLVPGRSDSPVEPDPPVVALSTLPTYGPLEHDGGLVAMRGEPSTPQAVPRYRPSMTFMWGLRPTNAVQGDVGVRLFALGAGPAKLLATDGLVQVSPTGSVRIAGTIDALGLGRGEWTIVAVVGRPATLPSDPALVRDAADGETWIVRRQALVIED